jgi:hypothetical protein
VREKERKGKKRKEKSECERKGKKRVSVRASMEEKRVSVRAREEEKNQVRVFRSRSPLSL